VHKLLRGDVRHTYSIRGVCVIASCRFFFLLAVFVFGTCRILILLTPIFRYPTSGYPAARRRRAPPWSELGLWVPLLAANFLLNHNRLQLPLGYCKWGVWFCPRSGEHFQEVMRVLVQSCHG